MGHSAHSDIGNTSVLHDIDLYSATSFERHSAHTITCLFQSVKGVESSFRNMVVCQDLKLANSSQWLAVHAG